jgi:hypothetical protein
MRRLLIKIIGHFLSISIFMCLFLFSLFITYGYRYDFEENQVVQTSVVDVCIIPQQAELYLDGTLYSDKSCEQIFGINVGAHTIEARKAGYYSWGKDMYLNDQKAAVYSQIFLVPLPDFYSSVVLEEKIDKVWLSPDQSKYAVYDDTLDVVKVFSASRTAPYILEAPVKIKDLIWMDNNKLIADSDEGRYEVTISKGEWKLTEEVTLRQDKIKSDLIINGRELWIEKDGVKKFVTRYSKPIETAQYFYNQSNLLITTRTEIRLCDFEGENCHVIAYKDPKTPVAYPARSKKIVFIKDGNLTQLTLNGPAKDAEVLINL